MIKNLLQGLIIGVAKIMPGVSGSLLAISLGVYEPLLETIADIKHINMTRFKFLFFIIFGSVIGVICFSGVIKYSLNTFYFPIMLLFIGLIIGGIPDVLKPIRNKKTTKNNIIILIVSMICSHILSSVSDINLIKEQNIIIYFILGLIEAFSSIVPGISGTAIYMSLGVYNFILNFFNNILNPHYFVFNIFFALGIIVGIFVLSKIITYLLKKIKTETYYAILGFMIMAIITMLKMAFLALLNKPFNVNTIFELFGGLMFLILGCYLTMKINLLLASKQKKSIL